MPSLEVDLLSGALEGSGPKIILSIRIAVTSPFFKPRGSFEEMAAEIQAKNSFTAVCLQCDPAVREKTREVRVGAKATSNMTAHLNIHHSSQIADDFRKYLEEKREEFRAQNPNRRFETRATPSQRVFHERFEFLITKWVVKTMTPLSMVDQQDFRELMAFLEIEKRGLKIYH